MNKKFFFNYNLHYYYNLSIPDHRKTIVYDVGWFISLTLQEGRPNLNRGESWIRRHSLWWPSTCALTIFNTSGRLATSNCDTLPCVSNVRKSVIIKSL